MNIRIKNIYNPGSTKPVTGTFQVDTLTSTFFYIDSGSDTEADNLTLVKNSFVAQSVRLPTAPITVGKTTKYELSLTPKNPIPASPSYLIMTFPGQFAFQAGACTAQSGATAITCAVLEGTR